MGGTAEVGHDLDYQWLTFVAPDGAARFLNNAFNITEAIHMLFLLLAVQSPPFEEKLDWLQFSYTADRTGDYMAPASMVLVQSAVLEGDRLFPEI